MNMAQARKIVFRVLASDCYNHSAYGTGQDEPECKTEEDCNRLRKAYEDIEREMTRRGNEDK